MKAKWILIWMLGSIFLTGCHADQLSPIAPESLSQNVYDALQSEWDAWDPLRQEKTIHYCTIPGFCQRSFDSWAECEEFLGCSIPNPWEDCSWLEKATYVGMPLGFRDAPHVNVSWYGTQEGHVEWISVESGYRDGEIRVMIAATLYGDPADTKPSDSGWSAELERQNYLAHGDSTPLQITSNRTENYVSNTAYQADGAVLYRFHIVGEPDAQAQVESTLEQVINSLQD